jgi:lysophospholipase L1-like esterase
MPAVRVLCLGDSLTAGYCDSGFDEKPYARALGEALGEEAEVKSIGYSGYTTSEILEVVEVCSCRGPVP